MIHWHGTRNINQMDGVWSLTQDAVAPDESLAHRLPLDNAGTFYYHAYNKAREQVTRGIYGPLIVYEGEQQFCG